MIENTFCYLNIIRASIHQKGRIPTSWRWASNIMPNLPICVIPAKASANAFRTSCVLSVLRSSSCVNFATIYVCSCLVVFVTFSMFLHDGRICLCMATLIYRQYSNIFAGKWCTGNLFVCILDLCSSSHSILRTSSHNRHACISKILITQQACMHFKIFIACIFKILITHRHVCTECITTGRRHMPVLCVCLCMFCVSVCACPDVCTFETPRISTET